MSADKSEMDKYTDKVLNFGFVNSKNSKTTGFACRFFILSKGNWLKSHIPHNAN